LTSLKVNSKRIVVKLSGSLFAPTDDEPSKIKKVAAALEKLCDKGYSIVAVAGGGKVARQYITAGRALGADESSLDQMGIEVSRLNARLLISASSKAYADVPTTLEEVARMIGHAKIVVTGGLHPGHSTNAVAALIAEKIKADIFINATDVDGVYSADPRKYKSAKMLSEVSTKELTQILMSDEMRAGAYDLMDLVALKIIQRSKIKTRIVRCAPATIIAATQGKPVGTLVKS
jgi:uridylate kinase